MACDKCDVVMKGKGRGEYNEYEYEICIVDDNDVIDKPRSKILNVILTTLKTYT